MSQITIHALLEEIEPFYAGVKSLNQRHQDLQTVGDAVAAHEAALKSVLTVFAQANEQQRNLTQDLHNLERKKREQVRTSQPQGPQGRPVSLNPLGNQPMPTVAQPVQQPTRPVEPDVAPKDEAAMRRKLKKSLGRFARRSLGADLLGQINRIADDASRPLGEALILLEWDTYFAQPLHSRESIEEQLIRLTEWQEELVSYHEWLQGEVNRIETREKFRINIWEIWRQREENHDGQVLWQRFIDESTAAKQSEINEMTANIGKLKIDIAELRAELEAA